MNRLCQYQSSVWAMCVVLAMSMFVQPASAAIDRAHNEGMQGDVVALGPYRLLVHAHQRVNWLLDTTTGRTAPRLMVDMSVHKSVEQVQQASPSDLADGAITWRVVRNGGLVSDVWTTALDAERQDGPVFGQATGLIAPATNQCAGSLAGYAPLELLEMPIGAAQRGWVSFPWLHTMEAGNLTLEATMVPDAGPSETVRIHLRGAADPQVHFIADAQFRQPITAAIIDDVRLSNVQLGPVRADRQADAPTCPGVQTLTFVMHNQADEVREICVSTRAVDRDNRWTVGLWGMGCTLKPHERRTVRLEHTALFTATDGVEGVLLRIGSDWFSFAATAPTVTPAPLERHMQRPE